MKNQQRFRSAQTSALLLVGLLVCFFIFSKHLIPDHADANLNLGKQARMLGKAASKMISTCNQVLLEKYF